MILVPKYLCLPPQNCDQRWNSKALFVSAGMHIYQLRTLCFSKFTFKTQEIHDFFPFK